MKTIFALVFCTAIHYAAFFTKSAPVSVNGQSADGAKVNEFRVLPFSCILVLFVICPSVKPNVKTFVITIVYTIPPV